MLCDESLVPGEQGCGYYLPSLRSMGSLDEESRSMRET